MKMWLKEVTLLAQVHTADKLELKLLRQNEFQ